jgi:hypothetical protein
MRLSDLFPTVEEDWTTFRELLNSLSRTDSVFWAARLNLIVSHPGDAPHRDRQAFAYREFLNSHQRQLADRFIRDHGPADWVALFFRGQLLELVRWLVLFSRDRPNDGTTFEDPLVREKFVQAALIASKIWEKRVFGDKFGIGNDLYQAQLQSLPVWRRNVEENDPAPELEVSLGRSSLLFERYLPSHLPTFGEDFRSRVGLSLEQYLLCAAGLICQYQNPRLNSGVFDSHSFAVDTLYGNQFATYLVGFSQTLDELERALWPTAEKHAIAGQIKTEDVPAFTFRPLRGRPVLRANDGRAIIVDPHLFSDSLTAGPLFTVARKERAGDDVFRAFGYAVEDYVCDVLRRMYPSDSPVLAKRLSCRVSLVVGSERCEIDACLNDVGDLVVFEIKAVWLPEDEIQASDPKQYIALLRKKYGVTRDGGQVKGIGQLARALDMVIRSNRSEFDAVRRIYPVLLVYDPFVASPVHGGFLARELRDLLGKMTIDQTGGGTARIEDLILMTVEELEVLESSVGSFRLLDLLGDYSRASAGRETSLRNFMATSRYRDSFKHNRTLSETAHALLTRAAREIFGVTV